ncbi:lysozyme [Glaesserella parasuis]|uniref:lysozyme n=1 Tax=Glaesserella parasuis TaxID=738 RepID=UPI0038536D77
MNKNLKFGGAMVCGIGAIIGLVQLNHPEIRTSPKGLDIIGNTEGCRRDPYVCPANVLSVGIGSTEATSGKIERKIYSDKEIADRWAKDLAEAERCVNRYANGKKMPQGAFDALTSITFNAGCGTMRHSTLFKLANQGYSPAMCEQFSRWVYANGKKLRGLEIRREKEKALCLAL